jgi:hypothetical protein
MSRAEERHGHRPRRPHLRSSLDDVTGDVDPAVRTALAHETAALVMRAGRADKETSARVQGLVDELGLEALADLWQTSPPDSLPGTLFSLFLLRTWVQQDRREVSRLYRDGTRAAEVAHVVAGVAEPFGPAEVDALGRDVLSSAFEGDLADSLERAAAFCRVLALGRVAAAEAADGSDASAASHHTSLAGGNLTLAEQLEAAASLWRAGKLR